jgi:hypothetical protein
MPHRVALLEKNSLMLRAKGSVCMSSNISNIKEELNNLVNEGKLLYKLLYDKNYDDGVVLEKHLKTVTLNRCISLSKKSPTIADYNDALKNADIIDVPSWRNIQRLGDLRNLCSHSKDRDPNLDEVQELINGVKKIIKTLF